MLKTSIERFADRSERFQALNLSFASQLDPDKECFLGRGEIQNGIPLIPFPRNNPPYQSLVVVLCFSIDIAVNAGTGQYQDLLQGSIFVICLGISRKVLYIERNRIESVPVEHAKDFC